MLDQIDWTALARQLELLNGGSERYSTDHAREALEIVIGEPAIRATVDHHITRAPGSALAMTVLQLLRPWTAMAYCHEIWRSSRPIEERRSAVQLLRMVADHRALNWVGGFLDDGDGAIQCWGIGVLDQLLWSGLVPAEDAEPLLVRAENHSNPVVRDKAEWIRGFLRREEARRKWERNFDEAPPSNV